MAEIVSNLIERRKIEIGKDMEYLEDELLRFKSFAVNYKIAFTKAYDEQTGKIDQLWEEFREPLSKLENKIIDTQKAIDGVSARIQEIRKSLSLLDCYEINKLIEAIEKFNNLTDADKGLLKILLDNKGDVKDEN